MRVASLAAMAGLVLVTSTSAQAQVTQTLGAGSAVTTITNSASFESTNALFDNPYVEGGMSFSRTGLTFDNNSCGFAGCGYAFPGFSGNYMYGTGGGGYFTMKAPTASVFYGLEFIAGSGYGGSSNNGFLWEAFLGGNSVSSGVIYGAVTKVIGFSSATGFDELRYTEQGGFAPAFDEVIAQTSSAVPEPGTWALMAAGLVMVGGIASRRKRASIA